jgi:hypothetical protein
VSVSNVDAKQVVGAVTLDPGQNVAAWGMQVDEESGLFFAAILSQDKIGIADVNTLMTLGYIPTGKCPYAVRLDTVRKLGIVTNQYDNSVTVFDLAAVRSALGR